MSGGDSPSCLNPSSIIDSPDWNLGPLEQDTENLIQRASERLRKLTNIFSKVFIVRRIQTWKNIRKAELIHSEIESLLPRLSVKHQNIQKWLSSLKTCKINLIMQGLSLTRDLQNAVNSYQARLEYNDELSNDCLQNNFDISRITHDLLASLNFTVEVLYLDHNSKHPHNLVKQKSFGCMSNSSHSHHHHAHSQSHNHRSPSTPKPIKGTPNQTQIQTQIQTNQCNNKGHKYVKSKLSTKKEVTVDNCNEKDKGEADNLKLLTADNLALLNQHLSANVKAAFLMKNDIAIDQNSPNVMVERLDNKKRFFGEIAPMGDVTTYMFGYLENLDTVSILNPENTNHDGNPSSGIATSFTSSMSLHTESNSSSFGVCEGGSGTNSPIAVDLHSCDIYSDTSSEGGCNDDCTGVDETTLPNQSVSSPMDLYGSTVPANKPVSLSTSIHTDTCFVPPDPLEPAVWQGFGVARRNTLNSNLRIGVPAAIPYNRKLSGSKILSTANLNRINSSQHDGKYKHYAEDDGRIGLSTSDHIFSLGDRKGSKYHSASHIDVSHNNVLTHEDEAKTAQFTNGLSYSCSSNAENAGVSTNDSNSIFISGCSTKLQEVVVATNYSNSDQTKHPIARKDVTHESSHFQLQDPSNECHFEKSNLDIIFSSTSVSVESSQAQRQISLEKSNRSQMNSEPVSNAFLTQLQEHREGMSKYEEMEYNRYIQLLNIKEPYVLNDPDYVDICSRIRKCHETRHKNNLVLQAIKSAQENDKATVKVKKCLLVELNKLCFEITKDTSNLDEPECPDSTINPNNIIIFDRLISSQQIYPNCNNTLITQSTPSRNVTLLEPDVHQTLLSMSSYKEDRKAIISTPVSRERTFTTDSTDKNKRLSVDVRRPEKVERAVSDSLLKQISYRIGLTPRKSSSPLRRKQSDADIQALSKPSYCKLRTRSGKNLFSIASGTLSAGGTDQINIGLNELKSVQTVTSSALPSLQQGNQLDVTTETQDLSRMSSIMDHTNSARFGSESEYDTALVSAAKDCIAELKHLKEEIVRTVDALPMVASWIDNTSAIGSKLKEVEGKLNR